jgi:hypothetical protein
MFACEATDRRLLVISSIGIGPPYMGNRARMRSLLAACRALGLSVHFAGVELSPEEQAATRPYVDEWVTNFMKSPPSCWHRIGNAIRRRLDLHGRCRTPQPTDNIDTWMARQWMKQARQLQLVARYPRVLVPYVFHSAFLQAFEPPCRRILDTHDKFAGRRERLATAGISDYWFKTSEAEERRAARRADVVLAIQATEAAYFTSLVSPGTAVREVGHFTPCREVQRTSSAEWMSTIGVLASDNPLNVDALHVLLSEVWPLVRSRQPQATLCIAGRVCSKLGGVPVGVTLLGEVANAADLYERCCCTVNAMRVGTGLKIKTLESLAHGCPVVTTRTGAEGLESCVGKGLVLANDSAGLADGLVQWLTDPAAAAAAGRASLQAVAELNAGWSSALADALGVA